MPDTATTYNKNYITQVILKIDFPSSESITLDSIREFATSFPDLASPQSIEQHGFVIEGLGQDFTTRQNTNVLWKIEKADDTNSFFEITKSSFLAAATVYVNYPTFQIFFEEPIKQFIDKFEITTITRLGLRYIDEISLEEMDDYYDWDGYIKPELTGVMNFVDDKSSIRRVMQNIQISQDEETFINLNHGMFNKGFPAQIQKKEYILDYECFTPFGIQDNQVTDVADKFNKILSDLFEKSIDDRLRELMR